MITKRISKQTNDREVNTPRVCLNKIPSELLNFDTVLPVSICLLVFTSSRFCAPFNFPCAFLFYFLLVKNNKKWTIATIDILFTIFCENFNTTNWIAFQLLNILFIDDFFFRLHERIFVYVFVYTWKKNAKNANPNVCDKFLNFLFSIQRELSYIFCAKLFHKIL